MSDNKILLYFSCGVIITSCFLTGIAVAWDDHPDVAIVDHFFDIHVDYDRLVEDAMNDAAKAAENVQIQKEWVNDLKGSHWEDSGTCTFTPDRDK